MSAARRRVLTALGALPAAVALPVAAQSRDGWPQLTETPGELRHGKWVWSELLTGDPDRAAAFYGAVFGWTFSRRGAGERAYRLARRDGLPVAGVLRIADGRDGRTPAARWIGMMSVPDVDAAVALAGTEGGRTLVGPTTQLGRGKVALLADPEGAPFGVIRAVDGDPPDTDPAAGAWLWRELWAADPGRMSAWYRALGHYTRRRVSSSNDRDEWLLAAGELPRAGVVDRGAAVRESAWLPYLRVADLQATLRAVGAAGGRVLLEPSPQWRAGQVAVIADATGAPLGVARWPLEGAR
jgi:predicted enzyme related to lactoylglutathione lyase